jgi:NTE family protein
MKLPIKKLGLGGGGAKGILHIGVIQELSKYQELYFPDGVYGTSIGAIIAVYVAFQIPFDEDFFKDKSDFFALSGMVPEVTFDIIKSAFPQKGMFTMDIFREKMIALFKLSGLDIETLTLADAKMPLFIVASNISKGVPTIFSENVSIIDALRCSCALPFVFRPQELYGQLYIDGDAFVPYIGLIEKDAFVVSLKTHSYAKITPDNITDIPLSTYIREIYNTGVKTGFDFQRNDTTIDLLYPGLVAESDLNDFDIQDILQTAAKSLRDFLLSKGIDQKGSESG